MSTYVIGDVQGCYKELLNLLDLIKFNSEKDRLWFAGDLVCRGSDSLSVLRYIKSLGDRAIVVLGNHDLHLLAIHHGAKEIRYYEELNDILNAPDRNKLLNWLQNRKLLHYDEALNAVMTHAGIYPLWTLEQAMIYAKEVEDLLKEKEPKNFFKTMYGNRPSYWSNDLTGENRYRFIINAFARMRFCDENGELDFDEKGEIGQQKKHLFPWFKTPSRKPIKAKIVFGHWAALNGKTNEKNIFATDTGCSWGYKLSAFRLDDDRYFSVPCCSF